MKTFLVGLCFGPKRHNLYLVDLNARIWFLRTQLFFGVKNFLYKAGHEFSTNTLSNSIDTCYLPARRRMSCRARYLIFFCQYTKAVIEPLSSLPLCPRVTIAWSSLFVCRILFRCRRSIIFRRRHGLGAPSHWRRISQQCRRGQKVSRQRRGKKDDW